MRRYWRLGAEIYEILCFSAVFFAEPEDVLVICIYYRLSITEIYLSGRGVLAILWNIIIKVLTVSSRIIYPFPMNSAHLDSIIVRVSEFRARS